jgi:glycosyltransferase involved in cell wall biosynthesis
VTIPVSVVIPTHNSVATIERALRSVASQSARPCEIVVVDDASSDATLAVVAGLARDLPLLVRTSVLARLATLAGMPRPASGSRSSTLTTHGTPRSSPCSTPS